jgi:hypothetical protein
MKLIHGPLGVASLGTLALTLVMAGCGGASPGFGGMATGPSFTPVGSNATTDAQDDLSIGGAQSDLATGDAQSDRRRGHHACKSVSSTQDFNGDRIQAGRWIWFSSVISAPAVFNDEILVQDSVITFTTPHRAFTIRTPNMRLYIHGYRRPAIAYGRHSWLERSPDRHKGEIFADGLAYQVDHYIPKDVNGVTWSARFYARHRAKLSWQWGAAVYSQLSNRPMQLHVKPTRFYNNSKEPAGTPLAFTQYLLPGGTGNGGKDYTGGLSKAVEVTPCP